MKLTISRTLLLAAVARATPTAKRVGHMPAIDDRLLLVADPDGKLIVTATDLTVTISTMAAATVAQGGRVVATASVMHDAVRSLGDGDVHIAWDGDAGEMSVRGDAEFTVPASTADGFPAMPDAADTLTPIDGAGLTAALRAVAFSASTDESRPNLCGVYLGSTPDRDKLVATSTDGHRLSSEAVTGSTAVQVESIGDSLIPRAGVEEIIRLGTDLKIEGAQLSALNLAFRATGGVTLFVRLLDLRFPDYRQVIPKGTQRRVVLETKALMHAIRQMRVAAKGTSVGVTLAFSDGGLTLSAKSSERGSARASIAAEWEGEPLTIAVNCDYLRDAVASLNDDRVVLHLRDPLSPLCVTVESGIVPASGLGDDVRVIMPMRI